jgi:nucleoside-diphosphate-sugar epimerase
VSGRLGNLNQNGEGLCNLVYVDDVAAATLSAIRTETMVGNTVINLGCGFTGHPPPTWNDYFRDYAKALGARVATISPGRLSFELRVLGPLIKLAEIAAKRIPSLNPAPPIRPWLIQLCRQQMLMNCDRARHLLPINWTPLEQGLQLSASWFHNRSMR